jgi:hypothetical protein
MWWPLVVIVVLVPSPFSLLVLRHDVCMRVRASIVVCASRALFVVGATLVV